MDLQKQLELLKKEYLKLEQQLAEMETYYKMKCSDSFINRLLQIIADLYNNLQYSDIRVLLKGGNHLNCHKFVLLARSIDWGVQDLQQTEELDFTGISSEVVCVLMKWVYSDNINTDVDEEFLIEILQAASIFKLDPLILRCEKSLIPLINKNNCSQIFETIKDVSVPYLKQYCSSYLQDQILDKETDVTIATRRSPRIRHNKTVLLDKEQNGKPEVRSRKYSCETSEPLKKIRTSKDLNYHGNILNLEFQDTGVTLIDSNKNSETVALIQTDKIKQNASDNISQPTKDNSISGTGGAVSNVDIVEIRLENGGIKAKAVEQTTLVIKVEDDCKLDLENNDIDDNDLKHTGGGSDDGDDDDADCRDEQSLDTAEANSEASDLSEDKKMDNKLDTHQCNICKKICLGKHKLMVHMRVHSGVKPYPCPDCGKCFSSNGGLQEHIRTHSGSRPYRCVVCYKSFITSSVLQKHKRLHSGEKPYECLFCSKTFRLSGDLKVHVKRHMGEKDYKCGKCGKGFVTMGALTTHTKTVHEYTAESFTCDVCNKTYAHASSLAGHKNIHTKTKKFNCNDCGQIFGNSGGLVKHKRLHLGNKPFKCEYCGHAVNTNYDLKIHVRTHTNDKPYQCEICGESFTLRRQLTPHIRKHTNQKPFSCPSCDKTFASKEYLQTHLKIHSGIKPHQCHHCAKAFIRRNKLTLHIQNVHDKPPKAAFDPNIPIQMYGCHLCEMTYNKEYKLMAHIKTHSEQGTSHVLYQCSECNEAFDELSTLQMHMQVHQST